MKKSKSGIISFFAFFILFSCSSVRYLDIQILKPAEINISNKIDKLYILDPSKIAYNSEANLDPKYYKLFILNFNKELEKRLTESPLFEQSKILYTKYPEMLQNYKQSSYQERKYSYICSTKRLDINEKTDTISSDYSLFLRYSIIYKLYVNYYNLLEPPDSSLRGYLISDTVFWDSDPLFYLPDSNRFKVNKTEAITFIGKNAAELFNAKIAPFWVTEERLVYDSPNRYMKKAFKCFESNDLIQAIQIWEKVYPLATRTLAAKAAHNMALSYELMDSISLAKNWAMKSFESFPYGKSKIYLENLKVRETENQTLNSQLKQTKR